MFGFEDRLLHRLAGVTNLFTSNHMEERYWPVHVEPHHFLNTLNTSTSLTQL